MWWSLVLAYQLAVRRRCHGRTTGVFQNMVDKAIIIENKIKEVEKNGKRTILFSR
jgi:hypothetical protein